MSKKSNSVASDTDGPFFLKKLRQYKDFLAILVFFTGGVMWIYGFFATKNQLEEYKCVTNTHITVIKSDMSKRFIDEEIVRKKIEYEDLSNQITLSNEGKKHKVRLDDEIKLLESTRDLMQASYHTASNRLGKERCSKY